MTELEIMQRAKLYMDQLARGVDPVTNQEVPEDSVLNNVRLARCFFYVSDVLGQVISNGGAVCEKPKQYAFAITQEQLARVRVSQEPVRVTQLTEKISAAVNDPQMKNLSANTVTNWLLKRGFLEIQTKPDGKTRRVPTEIGLRIGMSVQMRQGHYGEYQAVFYNAEAQQFVLDNLFAMLGEA